MSEIHKTETLDNNNSGDFDPDRRIDRNSNMKISNQYNPDKRVEKKDNASVRGSYNPDKRIGTDKNESLSSFLKSLKAIEERNAAHKAEVVHKNKMDGCAREEKVMSQLKSEYPESLGYKTIREAYLRDENGCIVKDKETGQARRIDFCVCKDNRVIKSIEVTSQTSDKTKQMAKEDRIKEQGGIYIKDLNGDLIRHFTKTEVQRYE